LLPTTAGTNLLRKEGFDKHEQGIYYAQKEQDA
jgi:hypothetical protein